MNKKICLVIFCTALFLPVKIFAGGNTWDKIESFAGNKRERAAGFSISNRGYLVCGQDSAETMKRDCWEYDPGTNSWTQKANFPGVGRRDLVAFAIGNKGYAGTGMDNPEAFPGNTLKDFWQYDPLINTWVQKADYPGNGGNGIYYATAFVVGNKGYLCTGKLNPGLYSNQLWEYDPLFNLWTQKMNFPGGTRYSATAFSIGGKGYLGTGVNPTTVVNDFWSYDPLFNSWQQIANLPATGRFSCNGFSLGNYGYVVLGDDGGYKKELFEYDPALNYWNVRNPYDGAERRSAVAFTIGNRAYAGTGKGSGSCRNDFYVYTPYYPEGIEENFSHGKNTFVFPNPMSVSASVVIKSGLISPGEKVTVNFYDVSGSLVSTSSETGKTEISFSRESLSSGTYFYEAVASGKQIGNGKIIVQ